MTACPNELNDPLMHLDHILSYFILSLFKLDRFFTTSDFPVCFVDLGQVSIQAGTTQHGTAQQGNWVNE